MPRSTNSMTAQHNRSTSSKDISWHSSSLPAAKPSSRRGVIFASVLLFFCFLAQPLLAQWVAYNDQNRGANTAPFVSTYSLTKSGAASVPAGGPLTNFATGLTLTNSIGVVGMSISSTGSVDGTAVTSMNPSNYTPAGQIFGGKIDWSLSSIQFGSLTSWPTSSVIVTFTNLSPGRQYKFRGTGGRAGTYANRWTLATLAGASNATHAHLVATNSPGIVTNGWSPYGDTLNPTFQALWNSGINTWGDVIGWNDIVPINNSFSVICSNWTIANPGGINSTSSASPVFAFSAFSLEEVFLPIAIVSQPQDAVACPGATVSFSVGVTGNQPTYQWFAINDGNTNLIDAATNITLLVSNVSETGAYYVVITNSISAVTSAGAHVRVGSGGIEILGQPQNQTNIAGTTASFSVIASTNTSRPISLCWYHSPVPDNPTLTNSIPGATDLTLTLTNVGANHVGYYFAVLTNCVGVVTSQVASLIVYYVPVQLAANPNNLTTMQSSLAVLSAQATGTDPITYQWYKEGNPIPNATNSSLVFPSIQYDDSGHYYVVAANPAPSSATSTVATVVVNLPAYAIMPITRSPWKYNQAGVDLGTYWTAPDYDDSAWPSGNTLMGSCAANYIGVANNPVLFTNTVLSLTNNGTSTITYYFRTAFVLTNNPAMVSLTASNMYAHGTLAYLNGTEVYRMNMPSGKITYNTLASSAMATNNSQTGTMWPTNIPMSLSSSLLVQGTNTLAVECHKAGLTNTDVYMGVSLNVSFPPPTALQITNDPSDLLVNEFQPASFAVGCIGAPAFCQWYFQHDSNSPVVALPGATRPTYTVPATAYGSSDGYYWMTISNLFSYATSAKALLTIAPYHGDFLCMLNDKGTITIIGYTGSGEAVTIPDNINGLPVSSIGDAAFSNCTSLVTLTIPNGVSSIGSFAFCNCDNLTGAFFQGNAPSLASGVFDNDTNATAYYLPGTTRWDTALGGLPTMLWMVPTITQQPQSQSVVAGTNVAFSVMATGTPSLYFQWRKDGTNLPGATSTIYSIINVQGSDAGNYTVLVTNPVGGATSFNANLTVLPLLRFEPGSLQFRNGQFNFTLNFTLGEADGWVEIQISTNLVNWTSLMSLANRTGMIPLSDTTANSPRFYRAVLVPSGFQTGDMALIPAGSFTMGNCMDPSEGDSDELPSHTVYVSAFYMDKYDVTKAFWDEVYYWAIRQGYSFNYGAAGKAANHPAQSMTWYDAVKWCNARSEMEGRVPAYYTDAGLSVRYRYGQVAPHVNWSSGYRLPTEAEWERAARGGANGQRFPWGNTISWGQANYESYWSGSAPYCPYDLALTRGFDPAFNDGIQPYTSRVNVFAPNGYGLYDMAGNVWQWCWDWYGSYASGSQTDPRGPALGSDRVFRGGGWAFDAYSCRTAFRYHIDPPSGYSFIGFRSVLAPGQ